MARRMTRGERAIWAAVYVDQLDVLPIDQIICGPDPGPRERADVAMAHAAAAAGRAVLALRDVPDALIDALDPEVRDLLQQMIGEEG